jgi:hypothetical protein
LLNRIFTEYEKLLKKRIWKVLPQIKKEFESFSLMSIWEQNVRVLKDNFFYKIKILEFIFKLEISSNFTNLLMGTNICVHR